MGNVAKVPDSRGYILSQRTIAFEVNPMIIISEDYLATVLRAPRTIEALTAYSSGGTAKGVSQKSLAKLEISVPTDLREQAAVSSLLGHLDNLITLHQRKSVSQSMKGG